MCGIAVIIGSHDEKILRDMMKNIKHRGPDDEGAFVSEKFSMGHTRRSIIDVEGGKQPIYNEDRTKCIVFNGEIYNYSILRNQLKQRHDFSTKTDTEIILHLYEEEGERCVDKLDGMFVFAIYDMDEKKAFLARDRIGIKPLCYGKKDGTIFFASEIKALLHCDEILFFPPGYYYDTKDGFSKYYSLPEKVYVENTDEDIVCHIRSLLINAVKKRLMSDVPVGVFLSGGIDSSIITAIMSNFNPGLHAFAVGMKGSLDLVHARRVAEHLGVNYHERVYNVDEMFDFLSKIIYHLEAFDAPLVRSALPCFFVSELANKHGIKVVLTGEGADELFAGYKYLKEYTEDEPLFNELFRITQNLHNTNLQRVDRLTMANSVEARVPFLDIEFLTYVFSIPVEKKFSFMERQEKWVLRTAFRDFLPEDIILRPKQKFSDGAGSMEVVKNIVEKEITDEEFEMKKNRFTRTKEEFLYYKIFKGYFPNESIMNGIGRTETF